MAQSSSNLITWSSSSDPAKSYKFDNCRSMRSAVSMELDQSAWQHLERSALHYPTRIQSQRSDVFRSIDSRHESEPVLDFQSGYNEISFDLHSGTPEVSPVDHNGSSVINGIPNLTESQPEEIFSGLDHQVKAPGKIKTGRRRRDSESGFSDGWVASKNLISERRRREKLQKGLITLRELVPMITMKLDKVSILTDAINHLQNLKREIEMLETTDSNGGNRCSDLKALEVTKSSCTDLETSEAENEGENQKNSSTDGSFSSALLDEVVCCDCETSPSNRDCTLHQIQLSVTKLDHGVYKLDIICQQQPGVLVQLSQAIEAFVIEIVQTSMVVITSTKVTCSFVVKMSSWNSMTLEGVKSDMKQLLGQSGLQFS